MGGWVAGKADIITNSAQLGLGLGLSLAKLLYLADIFNKINYKVVKKIIVRAF